MRAGRDVVCAVPLVVDPSGREATPGDCTLVAATASTSGSDDARTCSRGVSSASEGVLERGANETSAELGASLFISSTTEGTRSSRSLARHASIVART